RQLADRDLELACELAGGGALLRTDGGRITELQALGLVVGVPTVPEVDLQTPLRPAKLVQAEVGRDGVDPGGEPALGPIAMSEPENLNEDVLGHLLRPRLATDEPARILQDTRAELAEELLEGRMIAGLDAEHERDVRVVAGCRLRVGDAGRLR